MPSRPRTAKILRFGKTLPRAFYRRDPRVVAPELLNKILVSSDGRAGRVVEVEAYCGALDPAAHTYRGKTARNATMFGAPGHMYVYFTYGMHWCCNAVCGDRDGTAVLIRALDPIGGLALMREARPRAKNDRDLCSGPARLAQAMGITGADDGVDLVAASSRYTIRDDGAPPPDDAPCSARIGISKGTEHAWRWFVRDNENVSARKRPAGALNIIIESKR
ncbi:MAG: DNA-3-methyladenine glycosylase [Rudaea sp.]